MFDSPIFNSLMSYIMPALISALGAAAVFALTRIAGYFKIQITLAQEQQIRQAVADAVAYAQQMASKEKRGMTGTEKKEIAIPIIEADLRKSGIKLEEGVAGEKIESFLGQDKIPQPVVSTVTVAAPSGPGMASIPKAFPLPGR